MWVIVANVEGARVKLCVQVRRVRDGTVAPDTQTPNTNTHTHTTTER
jgi:hypothetical protein